MNTIGERITHIRMNLRYSQRQFASKISKTGASISRMENNESPVTEGTIDSIVLKFNVNREWLITGEGAMFNSENDQQRSNDIDVLRQENQTLRNQVTQLMDTVAELTSSINKLLSSKLGKLKASELNVRSKVVSIDSLPKLKMASGQN